MFEISVFQAVLNAPVDQHSNELCLDYGNRSAALFYLGTYKVDSVLCPRVL